MDSLLFSGTSNKPLADKVGHLLRTLVPYDDEPTLYHRIVPGQSIVSTFSDGETRVEIQTNVRGLTAFIVQSTCKPINDSLMELMLLADAIRRSSAAKIVAVVPYYGYSRQDRRPGYSRVPISARVVADMIQAVGIDHIVTVDLHATQAQGFFTIPTDNISATPLFVADIRKKWFNENPIIVSPDVGGVARARTVAKQLQDMELAIVDKRRPKANVSEVMNIIGDVKDKTCIMVDDMVDTAGTLCKAADALMQQGARRVVAYCTHPVLSGNAKQNIEESSLEQLIVTDTIPLTPEMQSVSKIRVLSTAKLIAETINRIDNKRSISEILDR